MTDDEIEDWEPDMDYPEPRTDPIDTLEHLRMFIRKVPGNPKLKELSRHELTKVHGLNGHEAGIMRTILRLYDDIVPAKDSHHQQEVNMEKTIEILATTNANLSNAYIQLQKQYGALFEELQSTKAKLAEYETRRINAPIRSGNGGGPKRATPATPAINPTVQNRPPVSVGFSDDMFDMVVTPPPSDQEEYHRIPTTPFETQCVDQKRLNYEAMNPGFSSVSSLPFGSK